jgi:hypothetical protein
VETLNFKNKRCLLLGSAPGAKFPGYNYEVLVAANGAVGLTTCSVDVLVTTAHLCRVGKLEPNEVLSLYTWKNRHFESIWVDITGGPVSNVQTMLKNLNCTYKNIWCYDFETRNEIVRDACGLNLGKGDVAHRVSTGFFALCLLSLHNPLEICIVGLGFQDGHYNKSWGSATKYHAPADRRCLTALLERNKNFVTTSEELNGQFKLPKASIQTIV